ncbi:MAG: hypothetical protein OXC46_08015 [Thaumarchaeota archaeon]|nr:hypothetical protein [Nitrososphaerota archaeon]
MTEVKYYREYRSMRESLLDMIDKFNELMRISLQTELDLTFQVELMERIDKTRSLIMETSAHILKGIILYNKGHTEIDMEATLNKYAEGVNKTREELANFENYLIEYAEASKHGHC